MWNYVYDHLLCDILHPGEAFIDFIAVSEKARYDAAQYPQDKLSVQGMRLCHVFFSSSHLLKRACILDLSILAYSLRIRIKITAVL